MDLRPFGLKADGRRSLINSPLGEALLSSCRELVHAFVAIGDSAFAVLAPVVYALRNRSRFFNYQSSATTETKNIVYPDNRWDIDFHDESPCAGRPWRRARIIVAAALKRLRLLGHVKRSWTECVRNQVCGTGL